MASVTACDRLIVALDVPSRDEALALIDQLAGAAGFYKVGLELFAAEGPALLRELKQRGLKVFLDLKMNDIGETVQRAVRRIAEEGTADLLTIFGDAQTALAAARGRGDAPLKVLQVTALTSLSDAELQDALLAGEGLRFANRLEYVLWRAEQAKANGCDGVIASGLEAAAIRGAAGPDFTIVCPGIRPSGASADDQKAVATPFNTIRAGADYLVVGRPIRDAPDPAAAAKAILDEIDRALSDK